MCGSICTAFRILTEIVAVITAGISSGIIIMTIAEVLDEVEK